MEVKYDKSVTSERITCHLCDGCGFIECDTQICTNCNGKKCCICHESGYKSTGWKDCERCLGAGDNWHKDHVTSWDAKNLLFEKR